MGEEILEVLTRLLKAKTKKFGLPPETLLKNIESPKAEIDLIQYNEAKYHREKTRDLTLLEERFRNLPPDQIAWFDMDTVLDTESLQKIGEVFNIHSLLIEDIASLHQRPKFEDSDDYLYLTLSMIYLNKNEIIKEQVSFLLRQGILISFQEKPGDVFDIVRRHLETARGKIRKMSVDYLMYALLDVILDNYFVVLNHINEQLGKLSIRVDKKPDNRTIYEVQKLKQKLSNITRHMTPIKELIKDLIRTESPIILDENRIYFKDLADHVMQINDSLDVLRDSIVSLLQYANSIISNKLNEIMKVLTVVSSIFIPLNFIASIYGMNFEYMPELHYQFGYQIVVGGMLILGLMMFLFFKFRRWI